MSPTKATKKPTSAGTGQSANGPANRPDRKPGTTKTSVSNHGPARVGSPSSGRASASKAAVKPPVGESHTESRAVPATAETKIDTEAKLDAKQELKREKAPSAVQALASELIAANDVSGVQRYAAGLEDERETTANQAARLMQELAELKPELLVPLIERFSRLVAAKNKRVMATCAAALAPLSRIAPAKVAKQLPVLTQNWEHTSEEGRDGLVRTFAGLCTASVAYQKRLEPALARALGEAEPKLLIRWTEIVLPALKGEPHARARAVVEERLPQIPRPQAQKIADFLGIKLRPLPR
jgi:hypothetical protein